MRFNAILVVARGGIGPQTRGFSVRFDASDGVGTGATLIDLPPAHNLPTIEDIEPYDLRSLRHEG